MRILEETFPPNKRRMIMGKKEDRLKNAGAFFLTPSDRTSAASGLTQDLHDFSDVAENYDRYLEVMYKDFDAGKIIGERIRPLTMRQTYRWEMFLLAELCDFEKEIETCHCLA